MSTFGTMQARILNELNRTDVTAEVQDAIKASVDYFNTRADFYFMEERKQTPVLADQYLYALPDDFKDMYHLSISENDVTYPMYITTWEDITTRNTSTGTGRPYEYAIFDNQINVSPIPDDSYTLSLAYIKELPAATATAAYTSSWFVEGERLIRFRAKWDVLTNVLHDYESAQAQKMQEQDEMQTLMLRTARQRSTGRLTKWF